MASNPSDPSDPVGVTPGSPGDQPDDRTTTEGPRISELPRIVGIGASAGGLQSLEKLFESLPTNTGLGFVVIQHLAPDHISMMDELLAKHTSMPVYKAQHGHRVEANTVHVIQPSANVEVDERGRLVLIEREHNLRGPNFAVDQFFRSLAIAASDQAIAIVLSGTGSDGSAGIRAVKSAGGLVLVESPASARFGGMPASAVATGMVDGVASAEELPAMLSRYLVLDPAEFTRSPAELQLVLDSITDDTGIDLTNYKPDTVVRRIERRRLVRGCESLSDYADLLISDARERERLCQDLLVGVSRFFRDERAFKIIERQLEDSLQAAVDRGDLVYRAWIAGTSTGEEAYSLCMTALDIVREKGLGIELKFFATDVNPVAVEHASRGLYPESIEADIPAERLQNYFIKTKDGYEVRPILRQPIVFAVHDVLRAPPFTRIDLLSCRNVLIYFKPPAQERCLNVFRFSLRPGGLLVLGPSESLGPARNDFEAIDERWRVYRMDRMTASASRPLPNLVSRGQASNLALYQRDLGPMVNVDLNTRSTSLLGAGSRAGAEQFLCDIIDRSGSAILVVSATGELLYSFGSGTSLLSVPPGRAHWKLADMLPDHLELVVTALIAEASTSDNDNEVEAQKIEHNNEAGEREFLRVRARRLGRSHGGDFAIALFFDPIQQEEDDGTAVDFAEQRRKIELDSALKARVNQLEHQLLSTRENLQATVEELEASNEELQATNEELVSSNEELQSTNEELQSVNEELHTVNAELQSKIEELSSRTDDLTNLFENIDEGILFLDLDGHIRRFNDRVRQIVRFADQDVGRPLADIATSFVNMDLAEECGRVATTMVGTERHVETLTGETHLVRIHPFRARSGAVTGLVVATAELTSLVQANRRLETFSNVAEQSPAMQLIADERGNVEYANHSALEKLAASSDDVLGKPIADFLVAHEPREQAKISKALQGETTFVGQLVTKTARGKTLELAMIHAVRNSEGEVVQVVKTGIPLESELTRS